MLVSWPVGDPKERKMRNTESMESQIELGTEDTMVERKTGSEVLEQMTQLIGQLGKWKPERNVDDQKERKLHGAVNPHA